MVNYHERVYIIYKSINYCSFYFFFNSVLFIYIWKKLT